MLLVFDFVLVGVGNRGPEGVNLVGVAYFIKESLHNASSSFLSRSIDFF